MKDGKKKISWESGLLLGLIIRWRNLRLTSSMHKTFIVFDEGALWAGLSTHVSPATVNEWKGKTYGHLHIHVEQLQ